MKIIRPKGKSFTTLTQTDALERGIRRAGDKVAHPVAFSASRDVSANQLPEYLSADQELVLRQLVSGLDKVVRKPRRNNLRNFQADAYVDRTKLGLELWNIFEEQCGDSLRSLDGGADVLANLARIWRWKVHPYSEFIVDMLSPRSDKNAEVIAKYGDKELSRSDFYGRWHEAFWKTTSNGRADYSATAEAIWAHLFQEEIKITKEQRNRKNITDWPAKGLAQAKGRSIALSAHDPAKGGTLRLDDTVDEAVVALYFAHDVVKELRDAVLTAAKASSGRNAQFSQSDFGRMLYEHFGPIIKRPLDESLNRSLWRLHNAVRGFYQELARSEGYSRAMRDPVRELGKLEELLPRDHQHLLQFLGAKDRNAQISALTRLGKLIAHASDLPAGTQDVNAAFAERFHFFQTSDGQSEIKRNEAFVRVWRTSVGLSLRTLHALTPFALIDGRTDDLTLPEYATRATAKYDTRSYQRGIELIFGAKTTIALDGQSRSNMLLVPHTGGRRDTDPNTEILWAIIRLAAEIRNRAYHFNTKERLLSLIETCPVKITNQPAHFGGRKPNIIDRVAGEAFTRLLEFDLALQEQVILDEFRRLDVSAYVKPSDLDELYAEFSRVPDTIQHTQPKFISVLRRAHAICQEDDGKPPAWAAPFKTLDLTGLSKVKEGANHFRLGVLRQLYKSGFAAWLSQQSDNAALVRSAIAEVTAFKTQRFEDYYGPKSDHRRVYAMAEPIAQSLALETATSLEELFRRLQSEAMSEDSIRQTYRASAVKQRERMGGVGEFRLDLFARLFALYLEQTNLNHIWGITGPLPPEERAPAERLATFAAPAKLLDRIEPWHSQFYVWLYLIPIDEVALLRHQLRKTVALEAKSGIGSQDILSQVDLLMGLYLSVYDAGFDGREHVGGLNAGKLFYESPQDFEKVYSDDQSHHEISMPGTRRGLRQILRMDHFRALEGIFEKHQVTTDEVKAFQQLKLTEVQEILESKIRLQKSIISMSKQAKLDTEALRSECQKYQVSATKLAIYNFQVKAARLSEHARLHQLMIRVLGRLADFSMMWERDRQYLFLGLLYRRIGAENFILHRMADEIGIALPADAGLGLVADAGAATRRSGAISDMHVQAGFLPLWDPDFGFVREGDGAELTLLAVQDRELFMRYFGKLPEENPRDVRRREANEAEGFARPSTKNWNGSFRLPKRRIRNDFAHFNVISGKRRPNLTYLMNAIRSLMSHDRKMKNAVSKAVAEIVAEEGLEIRWQVRGDRLVDPTVIPMLESHLTMVRPKDGFDPRFHLPQASVRFTSMVKALFEFDQGGYRKTIPWKEGKKASRGQLGYPKEFIARIEQDETIHVPREVLAQCYKGLEQK